MRLAEDKQARQVFDGASYPGQESILFLIDKKKVNVTIVSRCLLIGACKSRQTKEGSDLISATI